MLIDVKLFNDLLNLLDQISHLNQSLFNQKMLIQPRIHSPFVSPSQFRFELLVNSPQIEKISFLIGKSLILDSLCQLSVIWGNSEQVARVQCHA